MLQIGPSMAARIERPFDIRTPAIIVLLQLKKRTITFVFVTHPIITAE